MIDDLLSGIRETLEALDSGLRYDEEHTRPNKWAYSRGEIASLIEAIDDVRGGSGLHAAPASTSKAADGASNSKQLLDECAPFLREGETPAQCIKRNRDDAFAAIGLYYIDAQRYGKVRAMWLDREGGAETGATMEMCRAETADEFDAALDAVSGNAGVPALPDETFIRHPLMDGSRPGSEEKET